jgi:hypothetical protein
MKKPLGFIVLSLFSIAWLGTTQVSQSKTSLILEASQQRIIGGACPNIGCVSVACDPMAGTKCPAGITTFCVKATGGLCISLAGTTINGCGELKGYENCSITNLSSGCVAMFIGDQEMDGTCKQTSCPKASGTCGAATNTCKADACQE